MNKIKDIEVIILAAGKGTRLNNGKPAGFSKAMLDIGGKPIIDYTLDILEQVTSSRPILVVGYGGEEVKKHVGNRGRFTRQAKQLGTGHAAYQGVKAASEKSKTILVLQCDDSGFYKPETLKNFIEFHQKNQAQISAAVTVAVSVKNNKDLGRIVVDSNNNLTAIIEKEFMKPEDFDKYKYVNCGCYCFSTAWAKDNFPRLKKNKLGRYDITDLPRMANAQGKIVKVFEFPAREWHGINTKEQWEEAKNLKRIT